MNTAITKVLESHCASWAAEEPRFWTIPPAQHVEELVHNAVKASVLALLAMWRMNTARIVDEFPVLGALSKPSRDESFLGAAMASMFLLNFVNKCLVQSMPLARVIVELTMLPCHVYTGLAAIALLRTTRFARVTAFNLLLYCAWMPLLALAFPDLDSLHPPMWPWSDLGHTCEYLLLL